MSEDKQVVELGDAGVPADHGLSSLGLLMQLGGNLFAAYAGLVAFMALFAMRGSGETLWVLLLLGVCIARSLLLRNAGTQLLYGNGGASADGKHQRIAGIRRYIGFALMQTALVAAMLGGKFHVGGKLVLGIAAGLVVWPLALAVLMALPRFRRFKDDVPLTEDKGFEGASILMTVLGLCGLVGGATALVVLLELPGSLLTKGPGVLIALALVMCVIRSVLHVQGGFAGLRETSVDRSVELANRYANFGVISSFCCGGALLMFVMSSAMSVVGLALICGVCWMLMAWPLIIRRFYSDRQFADLLAGEQAPLHHRAPDAGLSGLGWLLIALAALSASTLMPQLFADDLLPEQMRAMTTLGMTGMRSIWFTVGLLVLQSWAGFELVRMSPQSRIVATVFGIVGAVTTLYVQWPMLELLKRSRLLIDRADSVRLAVLAMGLIIPVATIVLVNRKIMPTARARFRAKPNG